MRERGWLTDKTKEIKINRRSTQMNTDFHQPEMFAAALQEVGTDVELALIPGVDHRGILISREAFAAVEAFLARLG